MSAVPDSSNSTCERTIRYTPAVTIVAAWIRAETGVGPSMASGSHTCSGNCADLPTAPASNSSAIAVAAPSPSAAAPSAKHGPEVQRTDVHPDQDDAEEHRGVADPRRDERLLRGARGRRAFVPEADQQVRAQADALPAQVQEQVVVREDEHEHERDEQVQVGEERADARIVLHVADGVHVDQRPDARHDEHHRDRQRIHEERDVDRERAGGDPVEQAHHVLPLLGREREQVEEHRDRDREPRGDQCRREPAGVPAEPPAAEQVDRGAGERQRGDQPDEVEHAYPRSTVRSSTLALCRRR